MTTLIVDDDPFVIKLMTKQLESLGVARVKGVTNPADALTIVRNAPLAVRMEAGSNQKSPPGDRSPLDARQRERKLNIPIRALPVRSPRRAQCWCPA